MKKNWKLLIGSSLVVIAILTYLFLEHHATILTYVHSPELTTEILDESLRLGQEFLLKNQKDNGSFNYEYDFVNDEFTKGDSQVRQAGALWGVTLVHQVLPSSDSREAIEKGIAFFESYTLEGENGKYIAYPGEKAGRTGTMSLATLTLIDFLRSEPNHVNKPHYDSLLSDYLSFLISLRRSDGHFSSSYNLKNGSGFSKPSPYFDGETLLTLIKAANYLGADSLRSTITESAENMYQFYVLDARAIDADSDQTKGFFQWGSMSFYEIFKAGWGQHWAQRTIELSFWMIDTHRTLIRNRNTAYAYEGMISAWELARLTGDDWAIKKIGTVIDIGLSKLTSWQVGGPLQNGYLKDNLPARSIAIGGVMNHRREPLLRIDVTQHQCHALILARRFVYK